MTEGSRNMMGAVGKKMPCWLAQELSLVVPLKFELEISWINFACLLPRHESRAAVVCAAVAGFKNEIVPTNRLIIHELIRLHLHHGWFGEVTLLFLFIRFNVRHKFPSPAAAAAEDGLNANWFDLKFYWQENCGRCVAYERQHLTSADIYMSRVTWWRWENSIEQTYETKRAFLWPGFYVTVLPLSLRLARNKINFRIGCPFLCSITFNRTFHS